MRCSTFHALISKAGFGRRYKVVYGESYDAEYSPDARIGGRKSHSLAALYHLAKNGDRAKAWKGVERILRKSGMATVPEAAVAVFMGKEFDSLKGRGGADEPVAASRRSRRIRPENTTFAKPRLKKPDVGSVTRLKEEK